ncbi:MAG: DUF3320 domain-containing protein, partial [Novosphingobium sp.]
QKIEDAVAAAKAEWSARDEEGFRPARAVPLALEGSVVDEHTDLVTAVVGDVVVEPARLSQPYIEASFPVSRETEPHLIPVGMMGEYVARVVEVEGPIHEDEIVARIRTLWGLARAGGRIRTAVQNGSAFAMRQGRVEGGPFYCKPEQPIVVRDRSQVQSASLRKPDMLPPSEIDQAAIAIVKANFGASRTELLQALSRAFGFQSTSSQLRGVFGGRIDFLIEVNRLALQGDVLVLPKG